MSEINITSLKTQASNEAKEVKVTKLSNQALGALMMALQKSILEQTDITQMLRNFDFVDTEEGLWIKNPPTVKFKYAETKE